MSSNNYKYKRVWLFNCCDCDAVGVQRMDALAVEGLAEAHERRTGHRVAYAQLPPNADCREVAA